MVNSVVMFHSVGWFSVLCGWVVMFAFLGGCGVTLLLFGGWCSFGGCSSYFLFGFWF